MLATIARCQVVFKSSYHTRSPPPVRVTTSEILTKASVVSASYSVGGHQIYFFVSPSQFLVLGRQGYPLRPSPAYVCQVGLVQPLKCH